LEHGVRAHVDEDVEVARRCAARPGLALARKPDAGAGIHARGNLDPDRLGAVHAPFPAAVAARAHQHFAAPVPVGGRAFDHEEALLGADLAVTVAKAAAARAGAGRRARSVAGLAGLRDHDFYLGALAMER